GIRISVEKDIEVVPGDLRVPVTREAAPADANLSRRRRVADVAGSAGAPVGDAGRSHCDDIVVGRGASGYGVQLAKVAQHRQRATVEYAARRRVSTRREAACATWVSTLPRPIMRVTMASDPARAITPTDKMIIATSTSTSVNPESERLIWSPSPGRRS